MVAMGQGEVYVSGSVGGPWDIAAPMIILEEAGGRHTDLSGKDTTIHAKTSLSTNGILHQAALDILRG